VSNRLLTVTWHTCHALVSVHRLNKRLEEVRHGRRNRGTLGTGPGADLGKLVQEVVVLESIIRRGSVDLIPAGVRLYDAMQQAFSLVVVGETLTQACQPRTSS
jgi:hypothetical protein